MYSIIHNLLFWYISYNPWLAIKQKYVGFVITIIHHIFYDMKNVQKVALI